MNNRTFFCLCSIAVLASSFSRAAIVNVSTPTEFQNALTNAASNAEADTIIVAAGTYLITTTLTYTAVSSENYPLTIQGPGAGVTILDGQADTRPMWLDARATASSATAVSISGLTFQNGITFGAIEADGGGLLVDAGSADVTVRNCSFINNEAEDDGGGLKADSTGINARINVENSLFEGNQALGAAVNGSNGDGGGAKLDLNSNLGTITVSNSTFTSNEAQDDAGGLDVRDAGSVTLIGNLFTNNTTLSGIGTLEGEGGGTEIEASGLVQLIDNTFSGNEAKDGGGALLLNFAEAEVINNVFLQNSAFEFSPGDGGEGGGLVAGPAAGSATIKIINNTFYGNSAEIQGGGLVVTMDNNSDVADIFNNIIFGNSAPAGADILLEDDNLGDDIGSTIRLNNNDFAVLGVQCSGACVPGLTQDNNITADPLLVDGMNGDVHLQQGSPAIDRGDNSAPALPEFDFEGGARIIDGLVFGAIVDMGAAEFIGMSRRLADFFNPASTEIKESFIRVINNSNAAGTVRIAATDDPGVPAPGGDVTFLLGPWEARQITSLDLENGNAAKDLVGALGDGTNKWRLVVTSTLDITMMSLIRTPKEFVTDLSARVPKIGGIHQVYFFNPASESPESLLRIINEDNATGTVTISALDDAGVPAPGGNVTFPMNPNESRQITSMDLENGNNGKGLVGALGDGAGKWRLSVSSPLSLTVVSLIRTPKAFVTNLSAAAPENAGSVHVYFFNPESTLTKKSLLRVINNDNAPGTVTIFGTDDAGLAAPGGTVTLQLGAREVKELSSLDLEAGNPAKGVVGALGDGTNKWRLLLTSTLDITAMSLIETPVGFPTNLSAPVPEVGGNIQVDFLNPSSTEVKESFVRVINNDNVTGTVTISGIDDLGASPGGNVTFQLGPRQATQITSMDLEIGNTGKGLTGALGNGTRKWRLLISSPLDLTVMSLLRTPEGFLTNQSVPAE